MKKKIVSIIGVILLGGLAWYLFIKPYDYLVMFKANTFPGTINQTIKAWNNTLDSIGRIEQNNINHLKQYVQTKDSAYVYEWNITPITDSTSKIRVYIKDLDNSLKNKITIPFSDTNFEKGARNRLLDFNDLLKEHIKKFRVTIEGESELKSTYCAYVSFKGKQNEKAMGMMQNYSLLNSIILENQLQLNGPPFIEVTQWDTSTDSVYYNFCYPIIKSEKLPVHTEVKYKHFFGGKALKAIYNGNYVSSDRAWYALLDYAGNNDINAISKPIEVFHSNPNIGGNELDWKAEIFLPIKDSND